MTRARVGGTREEAYGWPGRAEIYRDRDTFLGVWCDWVAIPADTDRRIPKHCFSWREAMDYALGKEAA